MTISPFSFREFNANSVANSAVVNAAAANIENEAVSKATAASKAFLPNGRKKIEEPQPAPPPPPSFSEEQLKEAERNSYQQGFLAGIEEGKQQAAHNQAQIDLALGKAVEGFVLHYTPLFSLYRDMLKHQAAMLPEIAYGIAKKIAGEALQTNSYAIVEAICMRCLQAVAHEPKLTITIHESLKQTLEKKINSSLNNLKEGGEIIVCGDGNISLANCRIEWKNGTILRDTEALIQRIEQIIEEVKNSSRNEAEQLCNAIEGSKGEPPPENVQLSASLNKEQ